MHFVNLRFQCLNLRMPLGKFTEEGVPLHIEFSQTGGKSAGVGIILQGRRRRMNLSLPDGLAQQGGGKFELFFLQSQSA